MAIDDREKEATEIRRMLLWCKAQLPPHDLGYWYIERQPLAVMVENEDPPNVSREMLGTDQGRVRIKGFCECRRCKKRFTIPNIGNFTFGSDWEGPTSDGYNSWQDRAIAEAKQWVQHDAERDGPCWGGVPNPRDKSNIIATAH